MCFFFKQKTAYEVRISDWSSDVCSSDLAANATALTIAPRALTVTADALSRIYGDTNPALTFAITEGMLVNGDALSGDLATNATAASNIGAYAITQGSLAASSNYALTYRGANIDRTDVVSGKRRSVRVDLGGSSFTKKKHKQ